MRQSIRARAGFEAHAIEEAELRQHRQHHRAALDRLDAAVEQVSLAPEGVEQAAGLRGLLAQQHARTRTRQVRGRRQPGNAGADDHDVVFVRRITVQGTRPRHCMDSRRPNGCRRQGYNLPDTADRCNCGGASYRPLACPLGDPVQRRWAAGECGIEIIKAALREGLSQNRGVV